jgi:hypothetical protein
MGGATAQAQDNDTRNGGQGMSQLERIDRDAILLHALFALVAALALTLPLGMRVGSRLCGLVILYNVALPALAWRRGYAEWLQLWSFLVPLSALQVFPDWFLSTELDVLVFPDIGSPSVGPVPLFMAGLWTIPLFVIVLLGRRIAARSRRNVVFASVVAASLLLFVGSEATLWRIPIWRAQNVATLAHVAIYLLVPEAVLGLSTLLAYESSLRRSIWRKLAAAFAVMLLYLGGVCFFYLIIERLLLA